MIQVFMAWLALLGVEPDTCGFRVSVHESADVAEAEHYWADLLGVERSCFAPPVLKRHNPKTVRANVGPDYRGRLVVRVRDGADLYRRVEGWWCGIVGAARRAETENRT